MVSWKQLVDDAPDLAARVRGRFEAAPKHVLATRTMLGSPRVSGTEVGFWEDEMWIGSTGRARTSMDLRLDPRLTLHSNPGDGSMADGDAKIDGNARAVPEDVRGALRPEGDAQGAAPVQMFWLDLTRVVLTTRVGHVLRTETWRPGTGVSVTEID